MRTVSGALILYTRNQLGLSQGNVANKIKCNNQHISNVERGVVLVPIGMAKKLIKALKIDAEEMKSALLLDHRYKFLSRWNKQ